MVFVSLSRTLSLSNTCIHMSAPVLGAAVLAAVGAGLFSSVCDAVRAMVHIKKRIIPSAAKKAKYDDVFKAYTKLAPTVRDLTHCISGGYSSSPQDKYIRASSQVKLPSGRTAFIAPSLLSADFGALANEGKCCSSSSFHIFVYLLSSLCIFFDNFFSCWIARVCYLAGAELVHIDICDGGLYICLSFSLCLFLFLSFLFFRLTLPRLSNDRARSNCCYRRSGSGAVSRHTCRSR